MESPNAGPDEWLQDRVIAVMTDVQRSLPAKVIQDLRDGIMAVVSNQMTLTHRAFIALGFGGSRAMWLRQAAAAIDDHGTLNDTDLNNVSRGPSPNRCLQF